MYPGMPNAGTGSYGLGNSPYTQPMLPTQPMMPTPPMMPTTPMMPTPSMMPTPPMMPPPPPVMPPPPPQVAAYPPVQYSNNYNAYNSQQVVPYPVQYVGVPQIEAGSTTRRVAGFSHIPRSYNSVMQELFCRLSCGILIDHPFPRSEK